MNIKTLAIVSLAVALGFGSFTAQAAKKKNHSDPANPDKVAPPTEDPIAGLQPFIQNIDRLLAFDRGGDKTFAAFADQTSGRLSLIHSELAAQRTAAPATDYPRIDAALVTCDAISRSLDERQTFVTQFDASQAVKAPSDLDRKRLDHPGKFQYYRQVREDHQARVDARKTDDAMDAAALNRWNARAIQLRQVIQADYARILVVGKS